MNIKKETLHSSLETASSKQLAILKKHFPNCFDSEGNFILEQLLEIVNKSDVEVTKEYYELNWLGKSYARLLGNLPPKSLIYPDYEHNSHELHKDSKNLLVKGDNLEVLKHLANAYSEQIKVIYIDPPYNTGTDGFTYKDDRKFTKEQLSSLAGIDVSEAERILSFNDKGSSSHSAWLTFIYPRLYVARELMHDEGVIFISIDDNEVNQLKLICDQVFGEFNCLGTIIHSKLNSKSDTKNIQKNHDYILCYRRTSIKEVSLVNDEVVEKEVFKDGERYYVLNDPITTRGDGGTLNKRKNLGYTVYYNPESKDFLGVADYNIELAITSNIENEVYSDNIELISKGYIKIRPPRVRGKLGVWTWDLNKFNSEKDNILIKETKSGFSVRKRTFVSQEDVTSRDGRYYLKTEALGNSRSIIEYSTNEGTTQLLDVLGKADIFSNPKNVNMLKYLFGLIQSNDFIALDFFAGSGSSVQAIQELNLLDNGSRQFIAVQLDEKCKPDSTALEAGYASIFDITKDRISKSAQIIKNKNPSYGGDLGFKIFEIVDDFRPEEDNEQPLLNLTMFKDAVLTEKQYNTLLTTWALHDGSYLTTPIYDVNLSGYTAHLCDRRLYMIAPNFTSDALKALLHKLDDTNDKRFAPNKIIYYANNFDSVKQMELNEALKSYGNKKSIEIDVVVRN